MAHKKGCKIIGATLTPCNGLGAIIGGGQYDSPEGQAIHRAVNEWIRTGGEFDAVIDFEKAVCDPSDPTKLLPAYDSGDHGHPNDAGHEALANAVDLNLFK
jgi:lysophospholipase L1-like esterase